MIHLETEFNKVRSMLNLGMHAVVPACNSGRLVAAWNCVLAGFGVAFKGPHQVAVRSDIW